MDTNSVVVHFQGANEMRVELHIKQVFDLGSGVLSHDGL